MCSRKPWRFLLIAFIPAALTAALLSAVAGPSYGGRCQKQRTAAPQVADVQQNQQIRQETKESAAANTNVAGAPSFTQLTSWYEDQKLRAWFAQHSGTTCESSVSDKHTCQFVKPRRLSIVIPERADATLDSQLPLLAQALAAAPPDVQVDIIHYRNANALPVQNIEPTDVAELMLCAKLPQSPSGLYQTCIDSLSPRLDSPNRKLAHFWQVTLAPMAPKSSDPTTREQSPSLQSLLSTLQPQSQTALIALGHWTHDEILSATENINPAVHLTVLTSQAPQSAPTRACGLSSSNPSKRVSFPKPLSTPASLAVLSTDTANAQALNSAVWRRYQLQPKEVATRDCNTRQGMCGLAGGSWYASYLRILLLWYSVGLLCLFAFWAARRTPPENQTPK